MRFRRLRALAGYAAIFGVLGGFVLFANGGIDRLLARHHDVATKLAPYVINLESAALTAKAAANDERGYLLAGDRKFADEFDSRRTMVTHSLAAARADALHEAARRRVDEISAAVDEWWVEVRQELNLARTDRPAAIAASLGANRDARKRYEAMFRQAITEARADLTASVRSANAAAGRTKLDLLFLLLGTVLFAALVAAVLVRQRSLRQQSDLHLYQAQHDALTGLPSRAMFADLLRHALARLGPGPGGVAVMLIDLDRFKEVNDTLGHRCGDLLLKEIGPRLKSVLRSSDTIARLGGDEFGVLLPDTDEAGVTSTAKRVRDALYSSFVLCDVTVDLEASIGVAVAPTHGNQAEELLRHADMAMYHAKESHTGVAVYDAGTHLNAPSRLLMLGELRRALARPGELVLYYQPKVDLASEELCGVEALIRWHHPERGLVLPGEFIPVAENTGLINLLTTHALTLAVRQARAWLDRGCPVPISVNLSPRCLHDTTLAAQVAQLLTDHEVAPELLHLELTESAVIANPARALDILHDLRELGVRLSVDDFGTGYSSMSQLKRLPVDELKIDRSLVTDMDAHNDTAIVRAAVDLGHNLGLTVVAEGIETEHQARVLASLGCDVAQGYYYARPMPADDMPAWLPRLRTMTPDEARISR